MVAATPCTLGTLASGGDRTFVVTLQGTAATVGVVAGAVTTTTLDPLLTNNEDEAALQILQPTIRLLPAVARPGMVVLAYGEDMPPGSEVTLAWNRGITVDRGPYRVAADGTMRASLLVVRRDLLGKRRLVASSDSDEFSPVTGPLLVVLRLLSAPGFLGRGCDLPGGRGTARHHP